MLCLHLTVFLPGHAYSSYHGAARAISGGPVLITDEPGSHSLPLINAMTALSPSNTRVAIRPHLAVATDGWDSFAAGQLLKIGANTDTGARILGLFNVAEGRKEALIGRADFGEAVSKGSWVVRSHATGQVFVPEADGPGALVKVRLDVRGWDVLSAYPVLEVGRGARVAVLGLTDKISGAAASTMCEVVDGDVRVTLKALGQLAVLSLGEESVKPKGAVVDGQHQVEAEAFESSEVGVGRLATLDLEKWWGGKKLWNQSEQVEVRIAFS